MKYDVVIIGAGAIGSSIAMHLSRKKAGKICVIDVDLEGKHSSSELNAGGVRATWHHPINAKLSRLGLDYFESIRDEVGFRQRGYFWMYGPDKWPAVKEAFEKNAYMQSLGVETLSAADVTRKFSFIDKQEGLGGATFSPKDGLLNPNLLKLHYRAQAKKAGVEFLDRVWVRDVALGSTIGLSCVQMGAGFSETLLVDLLESEKIPAGSKEMKISATKIVNATGAWAARFEKMIGRTPVVKAVRRQACIFDAKGLDLTSFGMFVDVSGVYFHPEAHYVLAGFAVDSEAPGYNYHYDGEEFFREHIWPALYERSTKFENLKHITGWAGLYEVSPDHSAVIGQVPGLANVYEAHSFSGRGIMQSYGAGLALSELMAEGRYSTIDLEPLSSVRFQGGIDPAKFVNEGLLI